MPAHHPSDRAAQRKLREEMRALGMTPSEIAAEMSRRYKLRPRAAWRTAWGWTLEEAADRYTTLRARDTTGHITTLTGSRLSEWEHWPLSPRKPPVTSLCLLAEIYQCTPLDLIDIHDRHKLPAPDLLTLTKTTTHTTPAPGHPRDRATTQGDPGQEGDANTEIARVSRRSVLRVQDRSQDGQRTDARPQMLAVADGQEDQVKQCQDPDENACSRQAGDGTMPLRRESLHLRKRVTAADVEAIEDFTQTFRRLDNKFGGGHAHGLAAHYFNSNVVAMLREGSYTDDVGRRLFGAASKLAHLTAWTAYDIENHRAAEFYFGNALELSASIGDATFSGEILAARSHHAIHLIRPKDALQLARASANAATVANVPALLAEACVLEANAHAVLGDSRACASSLDRAETAFDRIRIEDTPDWLRYLDAHYLAARFAHCFRDLHDWSQTRTFASKAVGLSVTMTRSHAFNATVPATAYVETDVDQACHIGKQVLSAAAGLQSSRVVSYISNFHRLLIEHHGTAPVVMEFTEQANETLGTP